MRRQRNTFELKEQEKCQKKKKNLNELEISNLLNKEFKVIVIKNVHQTQEKNDHNVMKLESITGRKLEDI